MEDTIFKRFEIVFIFWEEVRYSEKTAETAWEIYWGVGVFGGMILRLHIGLLMLKFQ